ncbi:MAG: double-CXXCG motif protein [Planctomycetes bacterium]|nr:double-CXXCG motif protein [Planctomycetota bacterium]
MTTTHFEVLPGVDERRRAAIRGVSRWISPGVDCSNCERQWLVIGPSYPTRSLIGCEYEPLCRSGKNLPFADFDVVRASLSERTGIEEILPGTNIGPLVGALSGEQREIVWVSVWQFLFRRDVWKMLARAGLQGIEVADAELVTADSTEALSYCEPELYPGFSVAAPRLCSTCGFRELARPSVIRVSNPLGDAEPSIGRLASSPSVIIANAAFKEICSNTGIVGFEFRPIS